MLDTALGTFLSAVKERVGLPTEVSRGFPSTQLCSTPGCISRGRKGRAERRHRCLECGLVIDRDVNAVRNIEQEGLGLSSTHDNLGAERYQSHARGDLPSTLATRMVEYYATIPGVRARWIGEAGRSPRRFSGNWSEW